MLHILDLAPFVDRLPVPDRLHPAPRGAPMHPARVADSGKLRIRMREISAKVHRDLPPTRMWSYGETALGPLIEARTNESLEVEWVNDLPAKHFLPIDHTLHGCGLDLPEVRTVVHVHGAQVPAKDDGYPEDWFVPGRSLVCTYPLQQESSTLWYHDHAMGLNRLNVYAGLFGMFLLRDSLEDSLQLPQGEYEVPLVMYDRNFTSLGQLFYPTSDDPKHPWVPEFSGDAILINGKIRPFLDVEPGLYRFRALNAANSRFFGLSISLPQEAIQGPPAESGPHTLSFHQIGTDRGLLDAPVELKSLVLAPAERADLLVDFSAFPGQSLHLRTGAFDILQFRVAGRHSSSSVPKGVSTFHALPDTLRPLARQSELSAVTTRTITLNESKDDTGNRMVMLLNRQRWHEPVTERPHLNTTEIWEFLNQTEDVHPMHLHLVRFQILDRRPFDTFSYLMRRELRFTGEAVPPAANEAGWKDVVQCPGGVITRVLIRFEGFTGRYLYHCHILEHEANDMMRPFEIVD